MMAARARLWLLPVRLLLVLYHGAAHHWPVLLTIFVSRALSLYSARSRHSRERLVRQVSAIRQT